MLIIRRVNFINTTSGICHSVWVTVRYAGREGTSPPAYRTDYPHRMTYTRCCIDTIDSPDDERNVARNMKKIEINIYIKGIVRQICYLWELRRDARSPEHKKFPKVLSDS